MEPNRLQPHALEYVSEELEAVVQRATQTEAAQIVSWQVAPLTGGRETVSAIYRLDVQVRVPRKHSPIVVPLVLKLVRMTPERRSSDHWNHWLREAEAYASGTLARLPAGLAAPACYGVYQHGDSVSIWLEYVAPSPAAQWTEADVGTVCYELGRFNGAYLRERTLPTGAD